MQSNKRAPACGLKWPRRDSSALALNTFRSSGKIEGIPFHVSILHPPTTTTTTPPSGGKERKKLGGKHGERLAGNQQTPTESFPGFTPDGTAKVSLFAPRAAHHRRTRLPRSPLGLSGLRQPWRVLQAREGVAPTTPREGPRGGRNVSAGTGGGRGAGYFVPPRSLPLQAQRLRGLLEARRVARNHRPHNDRQRSGRRAIPLPGCARLQTWRVMRRLHPQRRCLPHLRAGAPTSQSQRTSRRRSSMQVSQRTSKRRAVGGAPGPRQGYLSMLSTAGLSPSCGFVIQS